MKYVIDIEFYNGLPVRCPVYSSKERDQMIDSLLLNGNVKHISFARYYADGHISTRTYVS